jgi:2-dehydro-3-deoxyphosphogluconate aldolase / (4S)-4-hydroxy-2-oxoglutarate aldolase
MTDPRQDRLAEIMKKAPVIPVLIIDRVEDAVPLAKALVKGGIPVLEITLRTETALDAVRAVRAEVPDAITGVGTVLGPAQLEASRRAGAAFAVSPGVTDKLLDAAADSDLALLPGTATASDVMRLLERGFRHMKFFPAEPAGGLAYLKALASPLPEARFCPTGGIDPARATQYLALSNVLCVGGSWLAPADAIKSGDWPRIEKLGADAARLRG